MLCFYDNFLWRCCLLCVVWSLLIEYLFVYKNLEANMVIVHDCLSYEILLSFPIIFHTGIHILTAYLLLEYFLQ